MTKKQISEHANAARHIRKILRDNFPETTFSVRSDTYSGGSNVNIKWTNGPTTDAVNNHVKQFQYGHFDGMIDLYEYSNSRDDIPQVRFVMTDRSLDRDFVLSAAKTIRDTTAEDLPAVESVDDLGKSFTYSGDYFNWYQLVWRYTYGIDLTGAVGIKVRDDFTAGSVYEVYEGVTA